jgi:O-antigen ligase
MLFKIELFILSVFILSLPSSEALKNIFWLAYVIIWLYSRIRDRSLGGVWSTWDTLFLMWLPSGLVVAALSNQGLNEWDGATDLIRYVGIGWLVMRAGYSRNTMTFLFALLIGSTLLAASYSYFWVGDKMVGLHSVGHINHSAIYLAISAGASLAFTLGFWSKTHLLFKPIMILATAALFWATALASARGALLPLTLVFLPLLTLGLLKKFRYLAVILIAGFAITLSLAIYQNLPVVHKVASIADGGIGQRDKTWNSGFLTWRAHPIAGVGLENTKYFLTEEMMRKQAESLSIPFNPNDYYYGSHAHNLYANTLAERGIVGVVPILLVLIYWGVLLLLKRPEAHTSSLETAAWGGALSAWVLGVVGGLFNTTIHHEHALISMILLALWISSMKVRNHRFEPGHRGRRI